MTKFMVQWEDHPSHLATRLGHLLEHQTLVDVTLMCNTHTLRVHRAVLAAGSPYFETILSRQLGQHPLIVLKDMQFNVLKSLIEFMYCGETSVTEENLPALLQAAKFFQVRGLSSMTKEALGLTADVMPPSVSVQGETIPPPNKPATKRVNIQSLKPTNATKESQRMTFHTVAKTIPSKLLAANPTDNAQLLLALSESEGTVESVPSTSRTPQGARNAVRGGNAKVPPRSGAAKQPAASLQSKPLFNRNYRQADPVEPTPPALPSPKKRQRYTKPGKKSAPCYAPKLAPAPPTVEGMTRGVLYQDPETNIIYQLEEPVGETAPEPEPEPEPEVAAEDEDVIYQLADGTITDCHGNPLLDKDGNTQNIANYQHTPVEPAETAQEGDPYDMPILLDNGNGDYTTAVGTGQAAADGDLGEMSVEQALEEMMGDSSATDEGTETTEQPEFNSTHSSILEETLRGTYPRQAADQGEGKGSDEQEGEEAEFATEPADTTDFVVEGAEFIAEGTESAAYVEENADCATEGQAEHTDFVAEGEEGTNFVSEEAENNDFATEAAESNDFATEGAESNDFVAEEAEHGDYATEGAEHAEFGAEDGAENADFLTEAAESAGFVPEEAEHQDGQGFALGGVGSNGVGGEEDAQGAVELGSSSLLKNALQKSGIDLDALGPQFADIKPAVTYQISQVDGKQSVRLVNVGSDSTVITPPKEAMALTDRPANKRRASNDSHSSAKRIMLDDDMADV